MFETGHLYSKVFLLVPYDFNMAPFISDLAGYALGFRLYALGLVPNKAV
jgi:hypothetical protein